MPKNCYNDQLQKIYNVQKYCTFKWFSSYEICVAFLINKIQFFIHSLYYLLTLKCYDSVTH